MPISPELMPLYPGGSTRSPKWLAIRGYKLSLAGDRCEQCRAPNRETICRGLGDDDGTYMLFDGRVYCETTGDLLGQADMASYAGRMVEIVLTIAHLDHNPANNVLGNIKALCQLCHNRHDIEHRRQTKRGKKAIRDLFGQPTGGTP